MAIFRRQAAARKATYHPPAPPQPSGAPASPSGSLPTKLPPKDGNLKALLLSNIPTLVIALVVAGLTYKLTGRETLENDSTRTRLTQRSVDLDAQKTEQDARKTELDAARNVLNAFSNTISAKAQQAQEDANKVQAKLGSESGANDRRRADIEEKRQKIESIRLTAEIVKARNDLIPNLVNECTQVKLREQKEKVAISCQVSNNGMHRINYRVNIHLQEKVAQKWIDKAVKSVEGGTFNTVPAKIKGGSTIYFELEEEYKWNKDDKYELVVQFVAKTDKKVVDNVRLLTRGLIEANDLDDMANQNYTLVMGYQDTRYKKPEPENVEPPTLPKKLINWCKQQGIECGQT